ncbi:MAG TPA: hypothetical protein VEC01_19040 [Noviherbaspirillum sp.]|uniref:hypothetical protein n=1 Tax=Noviherbaspirillum sp. TaxID=1926288 RepID=UPI002D63DBF6|nr:hypothetical protein [Noviherbaspirillum sp.]HYD97426.1 hypothetical protein [Noviherbaspirillum sp.]
MKPILALLALALCCVPPAFAQSGPKQLESAAGKRTAVTSYADSDGRQPGKKLPVAELAFPLRVYEETPTGMARIRHGGEDYWVALEDFNFNLAVQADCNVVSVNVTAGATRGANERCVGVKRK